MEIQIVSFNVPYPPDYGGVMDVFYKIKALHELGVNIHLHCYTYGRPLNDELSKYCTQVYYYKRNTNFYKHLSALPYIVNSRNSKKLLQQLNKYPFPVLLEGLHCTYPLYVDRMNVPAIVRTHNIEHKYYSGLANTETNVFKKAYFNMEAKKLVHYEPVLSKARAIAAISPSDTDYFKQYHANTVCITPFHPFNDVSIHAGTGKYILIHGDLSVSENVQSVSFLAKEVIPYCSYPFIIAGKNPASALQHQLNNLSNVKLISNPDEITMQTLVANAHINVIHSFEPQGLKLKLLHALYKGRFCICNSPTVYKTGLESLCCLSNTSEEIITSIETFMHRSFDETQLEERKQKLSTFSNEAQAKKLYELIRYCS